MGAHDHKVRTRKNVYEIEFAVRAGNHCVRLRSALGYQADVCAGNTSSAHVQHSARDGARSLRSRQGGQRYFGKGTAANPWRGSSLLSERARRDHKQPKQGAGENKIETAADGLSQDVLQNRRRSHSARLAHAHQARAARAQESRHTDHEITVGWPAQVRHLLRRGSIAQGIAAPGPVYFFIRAQGQSRNCSVLHTPSHVGEAYNPGDIWLNLKSQLQSEAQRLMRGIP
jgi:hypothetical protein